MIYFNGKPGHSIFLVAFAISSFVATHPSFALFKNSDAVETINTTQKTQQVLDTVKQAGQPTSTETATMKTLKTVEQLDQLKKLDQTLDNVARFKPVGSMTIPLEASESFKTLTVTVTAEINTDIPDASQLFSDNRNKIQEMIKTQLKGLNDKELFEERDSKKALQKVKDEFNKQLKSNLIVDLHYAQFEPK